MATIQDVYNAFLAKMTEDEWVDWDKADRERDWRTLFDGALPLFKFPRVSLEVDENGNFKDKVTNTEIQIIATFMKVLWLDRTILSWENVKPLYAERDFSQANLVKELKNLLESEHERALKLESNYYRSIDNQPYNYRALAGDNYGE